MSKAQDLLDTIEWLKSQEGTSLILKGEHKKNVIKRLSIGILKGYGMSSISEVSEIEAKRLLSDFIVNHNIKSCETMKLIVEGLYPQYTEILNKLLLLK
jgi:hypothetical protein